MAEPISDGRVPDLRERLARTLRWASLEDAYRSQGGIPESVYRWDDPTFKDRAIWEARADAILAALRDAGLAVVPHGSTMAMRRAAADAYRSQPQLDPMADYSVMFAAPITAAIAAGDLLGEGQDNGGDAPEPKS